MKLSQEEKQRREEEKTARHFDRVCARFKKIMKGVPADFDANGDMCFSYPNGQIFKCRGPVVESVYGIAPKAVNK